MTSSRKFGSFGSMRANSSAPAMTIALGLSLGLAQPAWAQANPSTPSAPPQTAAGEGNSGDIVVTARRIEERLQDVPISITVFNQQQLENRNIVNSADLASYTPSLAVNRNYGSDQATFEIRGFFQDQATQPSVGVFFADVAAPRGAAPSLPAGNGAGPGNFFDLQNVQVLKGPQGTLFGRNTTGGDVLLVPQKPTARLEGYLEGSYGNYNMNRVQGVINIPFGDAARLRIGVDHYARDGYIKNTSPVGPSAFENADYTAVRASMVVDLTPNLETYTIVSYSHSDNNGSTQKLIACNPDVFLGGLFCGALNRNNAAGNGFYSAQNTYPDPKSLLKTWQIITTTTWQASDTVTVRNIVSYAQLRLFARTDLFGTVLNTADLSPALGYPVPASTIPFSSLNPVPGGYTSQQDTATEELQIQARSADNRFTLQAGGYLELSDPLGQSGSLTPVFINCTNIDLFQCTDVTGFLGNLSLTTNRVDFRDHALYAQTSYAVTGKLKLTGGIRYTWDTTGATGQLVTYAFPAPNSPVASCTNNTTPVTAANLSPCDVSARAKSSKPTWLLDLDYKPSGDVLVYAKWSRGYRAGGINLTAPSAIQSYAAEKVDTYEAGLKTTFRGAIPGIFNVAGFYNNFTDQQLPFDLVNGNENAEATLNAGKSRIYGAEVELNVTPFSGFTLDGAYTYLNTKLQQANSPAGNFYPYTPVPILQDVGLPLLLSPKNEFTVTGTYTLPLDRSIGTLSVAATFTHTDKQLANYTDINLPSLPQFYALGYLQARNLLNLNLNWNSVAGSKVDVSLFATNVTQQKYYTFISGLAPVGAETAALGEPRMFGGRLRIHFGR